MCVCVQSQSLFFVGYIFLQERSGKIICPICHVEPTLMLSFSWHCFCCVYHKGKRESKVADSLGEPSYHKFWPYCNLPLTKEKPASWQEDRKENPVNFLGQLLKSRSLALTAFRVNSKQIQLFHIAATLTVAVLWSCANENSLSFKKRRAWLRDCVTAKKINESNRRVEGLS